MKLLEPSQSKGGANKAPPYPVEPSMIPEPPAPDPGTCDLVSAVQYDYYDRVVELTESDPNLVTKPANDGVTLLHWAAINDRIKIAEYLISKGAKIDAVGGNLNSTPLYWAIRDGKLRMVVFLLSRNAQTSLFDAEGLSAIHVACMFGYVDIIAYLIAKGEDVEAIDKNGMTPLMHAAQRVRNADAIRLIIQLGAKLNYQNELNKLTALHYAVSDANFEAIRILVESGANIDIRNSDNETPYDIAVKCHRNPRMANFLSPQRFTKHNLPTWLQFNSGYRRLGTKCLPYLILILVACILQLNLSIIFKILLLITLFLLTRGYIMIFFDHYVDRYLPISIAQASIFWLYACYLYYFLPYVHIISFNFIGLSIFIYFSWKNYYYSQKKDPGIIVVSYEQKLRNIIQLVELDLFDYENFCRTCLIRRPIRSKHCRECDRCISKFDHHCPWIDNCVGENNLANFVGFLFFTPICLAFFLYAAFVYYRDHCLIFSSETIIDALKQVWLCSPAVLWFTGIATMHIIWISGLCITILSQIATGYTTNETFNAWRYKYLKLKHYSPFSLGVIQNFVDLIDRRIFGYTPVNIDWSRIYTIEDFHQALPSRIRQKLKLSSTQALKDTLDV